MAHSIEYELRARLERDDDDFCFDHHALDEPEYDWLTRHFETTEWFMELVAERQVTWAEMTPLMKQVFNTAQQEQQEWLRLQTKH
jgi:hypothetical protein